MMKFIGVYDYTVILTYLSLLSATGGIFLASQERYTAAVLCLIGSGICDAFDGAVARSKKNRTEDEKAFGIQLDSLCDVISFGVFPAVLCYFMGMDGILGIFIAFIFCMCAVCRLAFFNVQEGKRQQTEGGYNKYYRGLPVTSISMILPLVYLLKFLISAVWFARILYLVLLIVAFLFILDFNVKKLNVSKLLPNHEKK